jgi:hypothetical protein
VDWVEALESALLRPVAVKGDGERNGLAASDRLRGLADFFGRDVVERPKLVVSSPPAPIAALTRPLPDRLDVVYLRQGDSRLAASPDYGRVVCGLVGRRQAGTPPGSGSVLILVTALCGSGDFSEFQDIESANLRQRDERNQKGADSIYAHERQKAEEGR